jgi:hypothetical protein
MGCLARRRAHHVRTCGHPCQPPVHCLWLPLHRPRPRMDAAWRLARHALRFALHMLWWCREKGMRACPLRRLLRIQYPLVCLLDAQRRQHKNLVDANHIDRRTLDQLIQDSNWISFFLFFLCFVLLIMLLQNSTVLCCTPPYTTCSPVVAATSPYMHPQCGHQARLHSPIAAAVPPSRSNMCHPKSLHPAVQVPLPHAITASRHITTHVRSNSL